MQLWAIARFSDEPHCCAAVGVLTENVKIIAARAAILAISAVMLAVFGLVAMGTLSF